MNYFKKYNLIVGWLVFAISAVVYGMTIEPTASFWDCSEFIATSYKLEVGHPPGAPLFMMISRFFSMFAPDVTRVAMMVNLMSALASAFTILFLFWSITHLARRAYGKSETELSRPQSWVVIGAGLIGALAYTFTDTFWFSAVEGEVYALSSMFTALVFWAMLKWENVADEPHANRWLVLIAYLMGLSIGIHLLNLLTIPALVFIYYFRKYPKTTKWGVIKATALAVLILAVVNSFIVPYTVAIGAFFDRIFVNGFGLPVNSGITFFVLAMFVVLGWAVYYTHKRGKVLANTIVLCLTVILLGYGSYASVIIRASANPPMNSNNPSNPYALLSLLNRDQYGDRPLLKGPAYSSPAIATKESSVYYLGDDGKYKKGSVISGYEYPAGFEFFFPRMYSHNEAHIKGYQSWGNVKGRQVPFNGEKITVPTFGENLRYFFAYQLNFMYWRYFLWNFVGRQSDVQSTGEITGGNWLSGIKFIDQLYLGPQDDIPSDMAANKGRNTYYFLPFILGIAGLIFQLNRDKRNFAVVMWLFFMMGIAMILYFNTTPSEPRERDYVFAGSFYAFCIWIGFGVMAVYQGIAKLFKKESIGAAVVATAICSCVPIILAAQNWDDHDRSHRYVARDTGYNYLQSTLPNSIIINYGDNDTFPLWYNQEVEGVRTDVRVMNNSYLGADWYIDEMRIKANDSDPVPFSLPRSKYVNTNELVVVNDLFKKPVDIRKAIDFIASDDPRTQAQLGDKTVDFLPAKQLALPVNKENVIASGIVRPEDADLIEDTIYLNIQKSALDKSELMQLDMLATFDWKRPIYFTHTQNIAALGLRDYLQFDGYAYRLVPIKTPAKSYTEVGRIDTEYLYDKLMKVFRYGNLKDPRVYADFFVQTNYNASMSRAAFARLAKQLVAEGDTARAVEVLDRGVEELPFTQIFHSYALTPPVIEAYYMAGQPEKANAILKDYAQLLEENISYMNRFTGRNGDLIKNKLEENLYILSDLYGIAQDFGQQEIADDIKAYFETLGIL